MKTIGLTFPVDDTSASETFTCPHCGKEYKSEAALAKHIKDKHPNAEGTPPTPA